MRRLKALLRHSRGLQEKRMLVDVLIATALSAYLMSPLPGIASVNPVAFVLLAIAVPACTLFYLYRRLKYYASVFGKKKDEKKDGKEQ